MKERFERKSKLVKLDPHLSKGTYHGFILKKDYWYGTDEDGNPVATSGWVYNGYLFLYTMSEDEKWSGGWIPINECKLAFPEFYRFYEKQVFRQRRSITA